MKEIKKRSFFEAPLLEVVRLTEKDIITASGDPFQDEEGQIIPVKIE